MKEVEKEFNDNNLLSITKYIVENYGIKLSVKLQKILYFLYLDYLKETNKRLFKEEFEAWVYGPVVPEVFYFIQGHGFDFSEYFDYETDKVVEIKSLQNPELKEFIDNNINKYQKYPTEELVNFSHTTFPWINARKGLGYNEPSNEKIKFTDLKKLAKTWNFL
ncbi:Panacea domain-containing protein [Spiroplasma attinicola]|uniref:Panacea domain-containing protein n=1 Tax=Spiroplasma attinicola TaxID=2904537 RepID=UPI002022B6EE|nr:type II toxin-antitoxin system antitoxin SocA domain-containing protein [Spiroplasma sp. JKS002670]MCL8209824.1 hypothetical protein [Spiroplasma sp. JKS002670]